jgi:hypothetical protein
LDMGSYGRKHIKPLGQSNIGPQIIYQVIISNFIDNVIHLYVCACFAVYDVHNRQVVGSGDIKVKGVGYTDFNQSLPWYGPNATTGFHVYDSYDLVMPAMEENALFVTTNMWVTKNQTRGICPSYASDGSNNCKTDADCVPLHYVMNGRQTGLNGSCRVNYTDPQQLWPVPRGGYCDVYSWCPTELEMTNPLVNTFHIRGVNEFTVFVRMNVNYPAFGYTLDNTRGANTTTYGANLWTLQQMVEGTGFSWNSIQKYGTTIGMNGQTRHTCTHTHRRAPFSLNTICYFIFTFACWLGCLSLYCVYDCI